MAKEVSKRVEASAVLAKNQKRQYVKQSDVPSASLEDALRVPQAIFDHYAGEPVTPLFLAKALNIDPNGSQIKVLTGTAIAFGLVEGGAQAAKISVTEIARRIFRPKVENEEIGAKREALLKPRVFGEFLRKYDGNSFPRQDIAVNVLEELGVPRAKAQEVCQRIEQGAQAVGFLVTVKDKLYVSLAGAGTVASDDKEAASPEVAADPTPPAETTPAGAPSAREKASVPSAKSGSGSSSASAIHATSALGAAIVDDARRRRVFITHGKSRDLVEPIKKLLEYGELDPVVSVELHTVAKPVPEKVMDDMRSCGAAIIHVDADQTLKDAANNDIPVINPNVLIEIGASMAFYGRRFILLVREGVKLPSNLQGLFEVRYSGATLDATATIKLLEAIKDIKNYPLPGQSDSGV